MFFELNCVKLLKSIEVLRPIFDSYVKSFVIVIIVIMTFNIGLLHCLVKLS